MCYVHNQWYDISCATLYIRQETQHLLVNCNSKGSGRKNSRSNLGSVLDFGWKQSYPGIVLEQGRENTEKSLERTGKHMNTSLMLLIY